MRTWPFAAVLFVLSACTDPVIQYETTDSVRAALAPDEIGCLDFDWESPPEAVACSFSSWIPQDGRAAGTIVIYANESHVLAAADRCHGGRDAGQMLYRDGQLWLGSIAAYADRRTARDIDDQAFVERIAELLGTDVVDC